MLVVHDSQGIDFAISHTPLLVRGNQVVQVSRSVRNVDSTLLYIIEVGISGVDFFPLFEDPRDSKIARLTLKSLDLQPVLSQEYFSIPEAVDAVLNQWTPGGLEVKIQGNFLSSVQQLKSFPYFLSMILDVELEIIDHQNRSYSRLGLLFLLSLSLLFSIILNCFYSYNKKLTAENMDLERTSSQRTMIIREVHHRVKNNLSLINSVIHLMIAEGGPFTLEDLDDLSARIIAIQKVHETLYRSEEFSTLDVASYLEEVTKMIVFSTAAFPIQVINQIRSFSLSSTRIIPLGIIVAELVTNAVKYGLEPQGQLILEGSVIDDHQIQITVRNNGKPYKPGKPGLGTQLVETLIEQLGGTVVVQTNRTTAIVLRFPLDA